MGGSLPDLADRLGLGERQLRRLFVEHVGASPNALARTRRAHFARQLIDQTALPMTEICFAAGFQSLRQFNDVMRSTFHRPPTEMRRDGAPTPIAGDGLDLRVPVRTPYDWSSLIAFLAPRAIPGVEQVTPDSYRRSVLVDGAPHGIEVTFESEPPRLVLRMQPPCTRGLIEVVERIKALFDADADPLPIGDHLRRDTGLAPLVRARPGLRVPGAWDGFELGVRAILGQQISVAGATTLAGRLAQAFGDRTPDETCGAARLFPAAERLAEADLAKIGMPGARARALCAFAREVAEGRLALSPAAPIEETRTRLRAIPGVGPWTVEYIALRALRDPDAFPAGDLGLRRALSVEGALASEKALRARSEAWRPWRAYAAMHLWTSLSSTLSRRNHARSS